jgi:hypothetical protein
MGFWQVFRDACRAVTGCCHNNADEHDERKRRGNGEPHATGECEQPAVPLRVPDELGPDPDIIRAAQPR